MRLTEAIDVIKLKVIPGKKEFAERYSHLSRSEAISFRKRSRKIPKALLERVGEALHQSEMLYIERPVVRWTKRIKSVLVLIF